MNKKLKYVVLIISIVFILGFLIKGRMPHEPFDSDKWKSWKETEMAMSLRWDMMNSLRTTHKLKGKTKEEIIELLGKPEAKMKMEFRYHLGMTGRGINEGSLTLKFDENGKVIDYYVSGG